MKKLLLKDYAALLDSVMQTEVSVNHFNGNVLVAKEGTVIYQKAFGYRNYDTKELLDNNSVFELASVSKQFTAVGILLLKDKGKLQLNDSLRKFFPELTYSNITIQQLLTHTSGIPEYMNAMDSMWNHKKIAFNDDLIKFLAEKKIPVNFKAGEKCDYSDTGYVMLASIIEKVSEQSFKDYMQQNIFKPLGMQHSRVYNTRRSQHEIIPNYAYGFVYSDSIKKYVLPDSLPDYDYVIYLDGIVGDGIINSTTGDLLKWDRALKNHTLLNEETQNDMFSPHALLPPFSAEIRWNVGNNCTDPEIFYGYGVCVGKDEFGDYISHGGDWPGYRTDLIRYLEKDITIIILSNNESDAELITTKLSHIVLN